MTEGISQLLISLAKENGLSSRADISAFTHFIINALSLNLSREGCEDEKRENSNWLQDATQMIRQSLCAEVARKLQKEDM